jgi:hypothetical protein
VIRRARERDKNKARAATASALVAELTSEWCTGPSSCASDWADSATHPNDLIGLNWAIFFWPSSTDMNSSVPLSPESTREMNGQRLEPTRCSQRSGTSG